MPKHCATCICDSSQAHTAATETRVYYADLDASTLPLQYVEDAMELLRGLGFPKLFASGLAKGSPAFIRVFWEVGKPDGAFDTEWDLYHEISGLESYLSSWMHAPHFTQPGLCTGYPDPNDNQYIWD